MLDVPADRVVVDAEDDRGHVDAVLLGPADRGLERLDVLRPAEHVQLGAGRGGDVSARSSSIRRSVSECTSRTCGGAVSRGISFCRMPSVRSKSRRMRSSSVAGGSGT